MAAVVNAELGIASYIEMTRFPVHVGDWYRDTQDIGGWCARPTSSGRLRTRIGYANAPPCSSSSMEIGLKEKLGYKTPRDLSTSARQGSRIS